MKCNNQIFIWVYILLYIISFRKSGCYSKGAVNGSQHDGGGDDDDDDDGVLAEAVTTESRWQRAVQWLPWWSCRGLV
jgi:hypothetical protein